MGGVGLTLGATGMVLGASAFVVAGIAELIDGAVGIGVALLALGLLELLVAGYLLFPYRRLMRQRRASHGLGA